MGKKCDLSSPYLAASQLPLHALKFEASRLSHRIGRQLDTAMLSMINGGVLVCGRYGLRWPLTALSVKRSIF